MKVLFLAHSCPYPPNKGDRIRNFHILKHLSSRYAVTLIYPSYSKQDAKNIELLQPYCWAVKTVQLSPLLAKLRCCLSVFGKRPITNSYYYSGRLKRLIADEEFDLVMVDCSSMAPYVLDVKKPKIIDFVDVDSDKWRLYAKMAPCPKSLVYNLEFRKLQVFEAELVRRFDASLVVSEKEKTLLPDSDRLVVVPNGVDLEFFTPRQNKAKDTLIFTGAMNYFPNIDGVSYFHREILPVIKREVPSVKFIIGGMDPHPSIKRLEGDGTVVTGYVPDMRDYLGRASVCVVPLRIGKGIQNKILEAMAMEIPVVATSAANNGIDATDGREILIADNPQTFARSVMELLSDAQLRESLAANARSFVEKHYSWNRNLQKVDEAVTLAAGQWNMVCAGAALAK
ncbi:MAG: TIGR03087 family PEP-CTERM/XrtA system glycosyltransferase [Nitrospinae bacterium]|nr:TIGR03087 family PEP-CTERM/XrtA system glycosyltransferase [Nitrospinota bacterium]